MKDSELYVNYISKLEDALVWENFENLDFILESIYTIGLPENELEKIDDILQESTLYSEFREDDYKITALELIEDFKN